MPGDTRPCKRTGIVTHNLNEMVSDGDGDGETIRPCEAKNKVGTHRRAGKLGDVISLQERAQETPRPDRKPGEKADFSAGKRQLLILFCVTGPLNSLFRKQYYVLESNSLSLLL